MINLVKRNLEQQVLKNQDDIEAMKQIQLSGLKILDILSSSNLLPDDANKGDCYGVYTGSAYELYVYTSYGWLNLGEFPKQGPQGLTGNPGPQGIQGVSTRWYTGVSFPLAGVKDGDMFLDTASYEVYIRSGGQWIAQTNIKGAAGRDGLNGNSITSIEKQPHPEGPGGTTLPLTRITIKQSKNPDVVVDIPDGAPGTPFHVQYVYPEDEEDIPATLPDDATVQQQLTTAFGAADASKMSSAIVYKTLAGSYLYVVIQKNNTWSYDNMGEIESVQGPAGEPGDRIMDSQDIRKEAAGDQYPNTYKLYIRSIPYVPVAPGANFEPPEGYPAFQIVMLPKSVESTTVRKSGFLYFFYEDPPTP